MLIQKKFYTDFSINKGLVSLNEIKKNKQTLITDNSNIYNYIINKEKIKNLILACEIFIKDFSLKNKIKGNITILAKNNKGYIELCNLINMSWKNYLIKGLLYIKLKDLLEKKNIIILTGGYGGIYTKIIKNNKLCIYITKYIKKIIPNTYIEIQRFNNKAFKESIKLIKIAKITKTKLCATMPIRYKKKKDYKTFCYKYCIQKKIYKAKSKKKLINYKNNYEIKNKEINNIFKDCKKKLTSFNKITKNFKIKLNKIFKKPKEENKKKFRTLKNIVNKLIKKSKKLNKKKYIKRIKKELKTIKKTGFAYYFIVTYKIIKWAKKKKIQVGPGRGSCASSIISYILKITDIDPIKHKLIFERFLNEKKKTIPDFDIDFCKKKRKKIIKFVKKKYKNKKVINIVTFNKFLVKNTIRDISRILGYNYSFSSKIINLIELGIKIKDTKMKKIINIANKLSKKIKGIGTHAGGLVISNNKIPISIVKTKKNYKLSQYDKYSIEKLKLVKIDILGLNTLTIINEINKKIKKKVNFRKIILKDPNIFRLIRKGKTTGIFQLEGRGIKNFIKRNKVYNFKELTNTISIYRPGPLSLISKNKNKNILKIKILKDILKETKGIILFQEQIILITQKIANYSLNKSDLFRAKIAKKQKIFKKEKEKFIKNSKKKIGIQNAKKLFKSISEASGYCFNKAHAVSYSYITYAMLWLKVYHTVNFFAAILNNKYKDINNTYEIIKEIKKYKIKIINLDINKSKYKFTKKNQKIMFGFIGIKGLGKKVIKKIIKERKKKKFKNIIDLISRFKKKEMNKKTIINLYYSGALINLEKSKKKCFSKIKFAIKNRQIINRYKENQKHFFKKKCFYKKRNLLKEIYMEKKIIGTNISFKTKIFEKIKKILKVRYLVNKNKTLKLIIGFLKFKKKTIKKNYNLIVEEEKITTFIKTKNEEIFKKIKIGSIIAMYINKNKLVKNYTILYG